MQQITSQNIVMDIPNDLYGVQPSPLNDIHSTAIVIKLKRKIRSRDELVLLNLYQSSNATNKVQEQLKILLKHICTFMDDTQPNIIIGGDINM